MGNDKGNNNNIGEEGKSTTKASNVSSEKILDLDKLRLTQNFSDMAGVKKALLTVPVRKPHRHEFVRVHPEDTMAFQTAVLELKEERETYLVTPELWHIVPGLIVPKVLFTTITRQGVLIIWPVRLPGEDGRQNQWHQSALDAADMAKKRWIRVAANMSLGAYEVFEATGNLPEPEWPEVPFQQIVEIAFKGRLIQGIDHPIISQLLGKK